MLVNILSYIYVIFISYVYVIVKYKVFAATLLFRVYLSVKENDKSITHREG